MGMMFKEQCIELRKQGRSIIEIMRITGRAKTSIYTHIRDIPLSAKRWREIKDRAGQHIRQYSLARKGKSARSFRTIRKWDASSTLLLSHLLFDGELMRAKANYNNRSQVLVERVKRLMAEIYDFEPRTYLNGVTGVTRICYFNVALGRHLHTKSQELLEEIRTLPLGLKREFLRAFFDDEGCMTFNGRKKRQVRGYQKDVSILHIVQALLSDFGILSSIHLPNEVVVSGKENLQKFQKEINFSPGVCINGNRSNSIWKESLEKRELLRRAIASFKT